MIASATELGKSDTVAALIIFRNALANSKSIKDDLRAGRIFFEMGNMFFNHKNHNRSFGAYFNARQKFAACNSPVDIARSLPLIKLYGPRSSENRGGNFLINFFDKAGNQYPCSIIEQLACDDGLSIRTGCFCNPGIDELNNGISEIHLRQYFTSRNKGDYDDMNSAMGKTRGAIRISFGLPANETDIMRFITFCERVIVKDVESYTGRALVKAD